MKKYFEPEMKITSFDVENVVTGSSVDPVPSEPELVDGLAGVKDSTVNVSFNDIKLTY